MLETERDAGSLPGSGRSPRGGQGNPLQYSCLENPMKRGAWRATVHGVTRVGHDWATKHAAETQVAVRPGDSGTLNWCLIKYASPFVRPLYLPPCSLTLTPRLGEIRSGNNPGAGLASQSLWLCSSILLHQWHSAPSAMAVLDLVITQNLFIHLQNKKFR